MTSAPHLSIWVFDRKRRIMCPSQHTGTICSLMHIDVRIKANQAGRHHPHHPPIALPPCSHLFVPVLKHELRTCPADKPLKHTTMIEGHSLSSALPPRSRFTLHPYVHMRQQLSAATVVHTGFKINARPSWSDAQRAAD